MMGWFIGLAVVIGSVVLIVRTATTRGARRTIASPRRLFRSLCQVHRLNWSDRRLLRRLARARGLADANQLFIDPRCFDAEASRGPLHAHAGRIAELRQQLFGG